MTVTNNSQRFLQNLSSILQKGQRERENILSLLNGAVAKIVKTRDENTVLRGQLEEMTRKFNSAAEHMRDLERKNEVLENDIRVMTSAIDAASREFAESDAILTDRVMALGSEISVSVPDFGPAKDATSNFSGRRAVVRGASVSSVEEAEDNVEERMRKTMDQLGFLLNQDNDRPLRPISIV